MKLLLSLCLQISVLGLAANSYAASIDQNTATPVLTMAYSAEQDVVNNLSQGDLNTTSQNVLNSVVAAGISALRDAGDKDNANQLESEWNTQYANYFTGVHTFDLGDHDPLFPWLSNFYQYVFIQTRGIIRQYRVIEDVASLNYALPVVFQPAGSWKSLSGANANDSIEYRKHFIPFAKISTYWASLEGCNYLAAQLGTGVDLSDLCSQGADLLEYVMGRHLSPKLSDWFFAKGNGQNATLVLTAQDFGFQSEAQFQASVLNKMSADKPVTQKP